MKKTFREVRENLNNKRTDLISESIQYHLKENIPLTHNIFRPFSESFFELFREARRLYENGEIVLEDEFEIELLGTDIGEHGIYEGQKVPLDMPIQEEDDEKNPPLGKPKVGGPKKFYVFVKDPKTGNIKKVTWGDTTGLKVKINNPEARKSFAARHKCSQQKDRTTAAYWACNLPKYAKSLGLSGGGNFYW